jgi:hypothetical protein
VDASVSSVSASFERFVSAAPRPQRVAMRLLITLAARPRGASALARLPQLQQLAASLLALSRYDEPSLASALGWDAEAVAARGRALRRSEGRP